MSEIIYTKLISKVGEKLLDSESSFLDLAESVKLPYSLGPELWITADTIEGGWSDNGDGTYTCNGEQPGATAIQDNGILAFGTDYLFILEVISMTAGAVQSAAADTKGVSRTAVGVYSDVLAPTNYIGARVEADKDFAGTVKISVKEVL